MPIPVGLPICHETFSVEEVAKIVAMVVPNLELWSEAVEFTELNQPGSVLVDNLIDDSDVPLLEIRV